MNLSVTRNAKPRFHGCHGRILAGSGRLALPDEWRLPELYLIPNRSETCLLCMPPRLFLAIPQRLVGVVPPREILIFRRIYWSTAEACQLDTKGRLTIPPDFRHRLDLFGRISLIGAGESFEVWNPQRLAMERRAAA